MHRYIKRKAASASKRKDMLQIRNRVFLTSNTAELAAHKEALSLKSPHFLEIGGSTDGLDLHLSVIHAFCETLASTLENRPGVPIVVCPENKSPSSLRSACLLCGAYMLLHDQSKLELVTSTLSRYISSTNAVVAGIEVDKSIVCCWRALERARDLYWLVSQSDGSEPALDLEMASHYALAANGGVHVLVPGKLLLAPSPAPLPAGQQWADISEAGISVTRHFSAGFLADLLIDLDVSAVAWLDYSNESDAAELTARGLDVHDLFLDPRRPALLGAIDRLLSVSRAAPGAVAVFGGGGGGGNEMVHTLAATWLMTEYGFDGEAAGAWLQLVCPSLQSSVK